jgi:hypothetical protein
MNRHPIPALNAVPDLGDALEKRSFHAKVSAKVIEM